MDEPSQPKPRLPHRPTGLPPKQEFRPRAMPAIFEERVSEGRPRRVWSRYCPLTLIATFFFLVLWRAALLAIGDETAAHVFGYTFLGLATLAGSLGMIFGLLSPPRHFESPWLLQILGNALGPLALAAVIVFNIVKEKDEKSSGESSAMVEEAKPAN